jgi:hypothetical protein
MKITDIIRNDILETATSGSTSSGAIATIPGIGPGTKVGTLFGGTYTQPTIKKRKSK